MHRSIWKWGLAVAVTAVGWSAVDAQVVVYNDPSVKTQTLGLTNDDSQTTAVHFYRYRYRPYYRYSRSYYYRPYRYSYYSSRPYYGYSYSYRYRPYYNSYRYSYYPTYRYSYYPTYRYYSYRPYVSYYGYCGSSPSVVVTLGQQPAPKMMPYATPPQTAPDNNAQPPSDGKKKQFPYDGGPNNPVPMPPADGQKVPAGQPKSPSNGKGFFVSFPASAPPNDIAFPAYGEFEHDPNVVTPQQAPVQTIRVNRVAAPSPPENRQSSPAPAFEYPAYGER